MAGLEDFTIHVEGKTIICDKTILREGSEYFRAMLDSKMIESKSNETTLQDQSYDIVKALIDSLKTGELEIHDNAEELVEGAMMLQIESAIQSCTAYLKKTLDHSNCFSLVKLAETFGLDSLYNFCKRHSLYYFNEVVKYEEFLNLTEEELVSYLSEKFLNVESELKVLDAVNSWTNSNLANEKTASLEAILECFHPEDLMEGEWEEAIKKPILIETEAGRQWLNWHSKPNSTTGKQYRELPVMFLTVGGIQPGAEGSEPVADICRFDDNERCFKPYRSLHDIFTKIGDKMGYSICSYGRYLYISGGQADLLRQTYETKVWRFDSFTEKWEHLTDMPSCRRHHGSCASESSYYIIGGFGKFRKCLNTFEEYNIEQGIWQELPNIPGTESTYEALFLNERIFIFANASHYFDIKTSSWVDIIPANLRTLVYPVVYNQCIYTFPKLDITDVLDEYSGLFRAKDILLLCSKYNVTCDKIQNIRYSANLSFGGNVVVVKKRIYIVQMNREGQILLISSFMEDLEKFSQISCDAVSKLFVKRPYLIALPFYPSK